MAKMTTLDDILKEKRNNPEYQAELEKLRPEFEMLELMKQIRDEMGLSQRELAELMDKPQSTIARIETGSQLPNLQTLFDLVKATGRELTITKDMKLTLN